MEETIAKYSIFVILLFLFVYFLPSFVAQGKRQGTSVFVLNLFLGWTFLGWLIALIWACNNDVQQTKEIKQEVNIGQLGVSRQRRKAPNVCDALERLATLKDKGVITEEEFEKQKKKILKRQ